MAEVIKPIRHLPSEVAAQVKSSVVVSSLCDVVLGLLNNSLDAGARTVDMNVDLSRGMCSVEDDGFGIPPTEFLDSGGLGKPYRKGYNKCYCDKE